MMSAPELRRLTLPELFFDSVEAHPEATALLVKGAAGYEPVSFREYGDRVRRLSESLKAQGLQPGERVCLLAENCWEWVVTDLAVLSAGGVVVPIYPTLPPAQIEYIARDSGATMLFASDQAQLSKAQEVRDRCAELRLLVAMDETNDRPEGVVSFRSLLEPSDDGATRSGELPAISPDDLASIVYTSGTTGEPKGAELTHANFTSDAQMTLGRFRLGPDDVVLSYIPLSHIFSRIVNYCVLSAGAATAFVPSIFAVTSALQEVRPTLLPTVPRLLESIQSRAIAAAARGHAAGDLGAAMGGRLRAIISGGGPLPETTGEIFRKCGVSVVEGDGLTVVAGVAAAHLESRPKPGTIGPPLEGVEARIAEDGEILLRGPNLMRGYYKKPTESAEAIDGDGWFHTGDIGCIDPDGDIRITDRKKDLIVLSNGKKVAPQAIERLLKASPFLSEVALFGDGQQSVTALVVPNFGHLRGWAKEHGLTATTPEELIANAEVKKRYKEEIESRSGDLADFEKVRRIVLIDREFSAERDELTPTLKLKRRVIAEHFKESLAG